MHCKLNVEYTKEEEEVALKQMTPLKALGPNGFGASFYLKHKKIILKDVSATVIKILEGKGMNSILNQSFIALSPKV